MLTAPSKTDINILAETKDEEQTITLPVPADEAECKYIKEEKLNALALISEPLKDLTVTTGQDSDTLMPTIIVPPFGEDALTGLIDNFDLFVTLNGGTENDPVKELQYAVNFIGWHAKCEKKIAYSEFGTIEN